METKNAIQLIKPCCLVLKASTWGLTYIHLNIASKTNIYAFLCSWASCLYIAVSMGVEAHSMLEIKRALSDFQWAAQWVVHWQYKIQIIGFHLQKYNSNLSISLKGKDMFSGIKQMIKSQRNWACAVNKSGPCLQGLQEVGYRKIQTG